MNCGSQKFFETIRGDSFIIDVVNEDFDTSKANILTMSLRQTEDDELILSTSGTLKDLTSLEFKPDQTKNLRGMYVVDVELSNTDRSYVETLIVAELKIIKDVSYV